MAASSSNPSGQVQTEAADTKVKDKAPRFSQGDEAMKITRVGMYVNVAMAATKGIVGVGIHSSALVADAAHSLSDLLADVVTLWSVRVARLPSDPKHPYGYGKFEAVGSLSVGAILSRNVDDVLHVSQVRARRMGPYTLVDLRVHLDARTSISMAQQISERVRAHILQEVPDVSEVLVHIDVQFGHSGCAGMSPDNVDKKDIRPYREVRSDIYKALATIPEITGTTHINTHWLPHLNGQGTVVDVAIIVQPDLKVGGAHAVAKRARRAIEEIPYIAEADIHLELQDEDNEHEQVS
ncbi:hypothetical protein BBO99_00006897 [Phytophthora kernoviae]|uniref:Cation efflux protein cytoplasmic domain-containing protein n=2 Tax=Phytophthora kernoviae TaxID=325452 RepID=A0A3R7MSS6_9STRA|nr:hypothetical protein G195_005484 [Phytophthora kernoviae 00238/432]KAG2520922.1 hypothetical protein JM16_006537 [Phytophthora kernoviae]KAG2521929.1 hypothetical protein JM18_006345 [Phytophthora kernoviae]RLN32049.1 hypothetical protein BBI17_006913 [Phytophthora kernoviae]RLN77248.1 hypothetical protein BBO99_00006897 [Phytophthora kernoviae]